MGLAARPVPLCSSHTAASRRRTCPLCSAVPTPSAPSCGATLPSSSAVTPSRCLRLHPTRSGCRDSGSYGGPVCVAASYGCPASLTSGNSGDAANPRRCTRVASSCSCSPSCPSFSALGPLGGGWAVLSAVQRPRPRRPCSASAPRPLGHRTSVPAAGAGAGAGAGGAGAAGPPANSSAPPAAAAAAASLPGASTRGVLPASCGACGASAAAASAVAVGAAVAARTRALHSGPGRRRWAAAAAAAAGVPRGARSGGAGGRSSRGAGPIVCALPEGREGGSHGRGHDPRVVTVYDLSDRVVDYEQAWAWQRALVARAAAAADAGRRGSANCLLVLQHPPVYTLGAGSTSDHLRFPPGSPPIPLYRTERGGEVTYHGPGQLVAYPILDLQCFTPDLHWYLRQLEQVVIEALDEVSGLRGERVEGLTGVWVGGAKVAAIGVRAKRWVAYHGLALNVVTDLAPFGRIVPCGIADRPVTSVQRLLAERLAEEDPFAPAPAPAPASAAPEEMIPLSQATQEDLRRMLARTGMSPPVIPDSPPPPAAAAANHAGAAAPPPTAHEDLDLDDPFAPAPAPATAPATPPGSAAPATAPVGQLPDTEGSARADTAGGGEGMSHGVDGTASAPHNTTAASPTTCGGLVPVRSEWTDDEAMLLREYSCALLGAFERVFGAALVAGDVAELERLAAPASPPAPTPVSAPM